MERGKLISLVTAVQRKEEAAATELYDAFYSDIYYHILKIVNNDSELAADLTQDTFIQILESIDKLEEPVAFVTWNQRIAFSKCTGYFKKKKELLVDEDEDGYSIFDQLEEERGEFIPGDALDKEDLKQTIHSMINALPEEQRSAILLRYFNEISVKEIAEIQGVSEGTVKSRLNYARKAIKQSVEEYEKKNDVKLHCAGVIPLLLWFFRVYRRTNGMPITYGVPTASFGVPSVTLGASTPAIASIGTKTAGQAIAAKITVGILGAAVLTAGIIVSASKDAEPTIQDILMEETTESNIVSTTEIIFETYAEKFIEEIEESVEEATKESNTVSNETTATDDTFVIVGRPVGSSDPIEIDAPTDSSEDTEEETEETEAAVKDPIVIVGEPTEATEESDTVSDETTATDDTFVIVGRPVGSTEPIEIDAPTE